MKDKVYCKDCKHHSMEPYDWGIEQLICNLPSNMYQDTIYERKYIKHIPSVLNENNNCKNFEKIEKKGLRYYLSRGL